MMRHDVDDPGVAGQIQCLRHRHIARHAGRAPGGVAPVDRDQDHVWGQGANLVRLARKGDRVPGMQYPRPTESHGEAEETVMPIRVGLDPFMRGPHRG